MVPGVGEAQRAEVAARADDTVVGSGCSPCCVPEGRGTGVAGLAGSQLRGGMGRHVSARPAGKRCMVVSSNGITISRLRNGTILHRFPSALPNGSKKGLSGPASSYSILDCIFHEPDETYYIVDMICWRGYSLYDCTAEFRFFWVNSKLTETSAGDPPSAYHRYRFSVVPMYESTLDGLQTAYSGSTPYVKDGLLFYNRHAHYQAGITPLTLVWKDNTCSQYLLDTDSEGQVPTEQHVVLELQEDGKLVTSDDPPIAFGSLDNEFIQKSNLRPGNLLRFSVLFQYAARHAPLRIEDLSFKAEEIHVPIFAFDWIPCYVEVDAKREQGNLLIASHGFTQGLETIVPTLVVAT
ncbi:hypothetical protein TRIUR3_16757 [Triticum urartu]|uniref:Snurportin-1 n=1 Tax=Triticum urartu TaxID=4572 RepID=M7Z8L8_TRIUA|nr:hypothetical protein TRIUR3_16757 [Triticum urartu]